MSDTPLQILGIGGGVDKNGVVSIEVPFWVASLSEAISHKPSLDITLPLVSRNFKQAEDGGYEVTLHDEQKRSFKRKARSQSASLTLGNEEETLSPRLRSVFRARVPRSAVP